MSAIVPFLPQSLFGTSDSDSIPEVASGVGVAASTWQRAARSCNWLNGRGGQLVAANILDNDETTQGNSYTARYYVWPRYQAKKRCWLITMNPDASNTALGTLRVGIETPDGATAVDYTREISTERFPAPIFHIEDVTQSNTAGEVTITFNVATGSEVPLSKPVISCFEVPRFSLDMSTTADAGVDDATMLGGGPIWGRSATPRPGPSGVLDQLSYAKTNARRAAMVHWYAGGANEQIVVSSTSYVDLFLPYVPVLGRHINTTLSLMDVAFRAKVATAGDSAELGFLLPNTQGEVWSPTITTTTYSWHTATNNPSVDAEDITASDGRRSSTWDLVQIRAKVASAGDILQLTGFAIGEDIP